MKYLSPLLSLSLGLLFSCAHQKNFDSYTYEESYKSQFKKKEKYVALESKNWPNLPMPIFIPQPNSRKIASVARPLVQESNKLVYFSTLYSQYLELGKITSHPNRIKICPYFHGLVGKLNYAMMEDNLVATNLNRLSMMRMVDQNPLLSLPISNDEEKTLKEAVASPHFQEMAEQALSTHMTKLEGEVLEMCEYGNSLDYYLYENLVTYASENQFPSTEENINTLRKSPYFINRALITSFQNNKTKIKAKPSEETYEEELFQRIKADWVKPYFVQYLNQME